MLRSSVFEPTVFNKITMTLSNYSFFSVCKSYSLHGTISRDVERSNLSGKFVVADLDAESSVIDRDVFVGG